MNKIFEGKFHFEYLDLLNLLTSVRKGGNESGINNSGENIDMNNTNKPHWGSFCLESFVQPKKLFIFLRWNSVNIE